MDAYSYIDIPRPGVMNMAIDDELLAYSEREQCVILRIYQWSEPTLSLGYFQKLEDRWGHQPSKDLPIVRRATGGGAIVHHHDVTYSLVIPQASSSVGAAPAVYAAVHQGVVNWLREFGLAASQWGGDVSDSCSNSIGSSEFLCFHRRSTGDVVADGWKVMGSAQRRSKGALLQHGSLLLATSEFSPSLIGLSELGGSEMSPTTGSGTAKRRQFAGDLLQRISTVIDALLGVHSKNEFLGKVGVENAANARQSRFLSCEWLARA